MTAHAVSSAEDVYIAEVMAHIPSEPALQSQITMDLRSHIAERLEHGESIDDVVKQLGNPVTLAESYLGAVPLIAGSFGARAVAKIVDFLAVWAACLLPGFAIAWTFVHEPVPAFILIATSFSFGVAALVFFVYTIVAEYQTGQTIGKRLMNLRVVRESGARISLGQAIVRQLPALLQIWLIDVLFALFTDKSQRAFELISKTRVVTAAP
jgi:uncharacterized RDD family membrane protein YckC